MLGLILKAFLADEAGATAVEYSLIAVLIGVATIGGFTLLGGELGEIFGTTSVNAIEIGLEKLN